MSRGKEKLPGFTPIGNSNVCCHVTIEAVFRMNNFSEMEEVLDNLRQYGAAVVVNKQMIGEGFEEAARIIERRRMKGD